jgi:hypothetical protein
VAYSTHTDSGQQILTVGDPRTGQAAQRVLPAFACDLFWAPSGEEVYVGQCLEGAVAFQVSPVGTSRPISPKSNAVGSMPWPRPSE